MHFFGEVEKKQKVLGKIKESVCNFISDHFGLVFIGGITVLLSLSFLTGFTHVKRNERVITEAWKTGMNGLQQIVEKQSGIESLQLSTAKIVAVENQDSLLSFNGKYIKHDSYGNNTITAVNVNYSVESGLAQKILDKLTDISKAWTFDAKTTDAYTEVIQNDELLISEGNKSAKAAEQLFSLFQQAVCEGKFIGCEEIGIVENLNHAINNEFNYVNTNTQTDVNGNFVHTTQNFVGHKLIDVSMVNYNKDEGCNYFYIETVSGEDSLVYNKARIEVKGEPLPSEDVYAAFLEGKHTGFTPIYTVNESDHVKILDCELSR